MTRQQRVKYPYQRLRLRDVLRVIFFLIVAVDLSGMVNACNHEMEAALNLGGHEHCDHDSSDAFDFPTMGEETHADHQECCESRHQEYEQCSHQILNVQNEGNSPFNKANLVLLYTVEPVKSAHFSFQEPRFSSKSSSDTEIFLDSIRLLI